MPSSRGSSRPREHSPGLPHCRQILYHLNHQESPCLVRSGFNLVPCRSKICNSLCALIPGADCSLESPRKQSANRKVDGRGQATAMSRHWAQVRQARLTPAQCPASCGTLHNDTMPEFPHLTNALDGEPPPTVPPAFQGLSATHSLPITTIPGGKHNSPHLIIGNSPHQASLVARQLRLLLQCWRPRFNP